MQLDSNIGSVITEADPTAPRTNWKPGGRAPLDHFVRFHGP